VTIIFLLTSSSLFAINPEITPSIVKNTDHANSWLYGMRKMRRKPLSIAIMVAVATKGSSLLFERLKVKKSPLIVTVSALIL